MNSLHHIKSQGTTRPIPQRAAPQKHHQTAGKTQPTVTVRHPLPAGPRASSAAGRRAPTAGPRQTSGPRFAARGAGDGFFSIWRLNRNGLNGNLSVGGHRMDLDFAEPKWILKFWNWSVGERRRKPGPFGSNAENMENPLIPCTLPWGIKCGTHGWSLAKGLPRAHFR